MNNLNPCRIYLLGIVLLFLANTSFGQTQSADYIKKRDALIAAVRVDFDSLLLFQPEEGLAFVQKSFLPFESDLNVKAWSYHLTADYYMHQQFDDSAVFFLEKSAKTLKAKDDPLLYSRNKTQVANIYASLGQFEKSLQALMDAKKEINDKSSNIIQSNYYDKLGQYYHFQSEYVKAIESYYLAEKFINKEPAGDKRDNRLARAYTNIGSILKDKKKAVQYYKKARALLKDKDIEGEHYCDVCIVTLNEINSTQSELNNLDTAIQYFKRLGAKGLAIKGLISKANVLAATGTDKSAEGLYLEGLKFSKDINYGLGIQSITNRLGILYNKMRQYNKSITYALQSLDSTQRLDLRFSNLKTLYSAYKGKEDYKNAHYYIEKYLALKEISRDDEQSEILNELETKYESEKKQIQIQNLEKENSFIKQRRWLLAGITALLFLIPILYLNQRSKKRKKIYQGELAKMQLASLKSQMSPHFMFNSINSIKGMMINDTAEAAADQLAKFSKFMRNILNYSGDEFISLQEEIEFLQQYAHLENIKREFSVGFNFVDDENLANEHIEVLPFLIQPFLENSFKHAFTRDTINPTIDVKFTKSGDWLYITIEDNGIGSKRNKGTEHVSKGTALVKNRLSLHNESNDNVKVDYRGEGKGTRVTLKLKV